MRRLILLAALVSVGSILQSSCCSLRPRRKPAEDGPPQKYAVLASVGTTLTDDFQGNSEFWYDLVLTYCGLLENGYTSENIFVLFGDGNDWVSSYPRYNPHSSHFLCQGLAGTPTTPITDIALFDEAGLPSKDNLAHVLCCLARGRPSLRLRQQCRCCAWFDSGADGFSCASLGIPRLREEDSLFLWIKSHGNTSACQTNITFREATLPGSDASTGQPVDALADHELAGLLRELAPDRRVLAMETCTSGGLLDDLQEAGSVVMASAGEPFSNPSNGWLLRCDEPTRSTTYEEETPTTPGQYDKIMHHRFSYWFAAALREKRPDEQALPEPADRDGNGLVSAREAFDLARGQIELEGLGQGSNAEATSAMHPGLRDPGHIGDCTYLALPRPGTDVEAYSRDHDADRGEQPSPAAWPPPGADCTAQPLTQDPSAYSVCATVRNVGCIEAVDVIVRHYAIGPLNAAPTPSTSAGGNWEEIGQQRILRLSPRSDSEACIDWTPPSPGKYLVITKLDTTGDYSNDLLSDNNLLIGHDNNKCQQVLVVPTPPAPSVQ